MLAPLGSVIMAAIQMPGVGIRGASIYQRESRATKPRREETYKKTDKRKNKEQKRRERWNIQCRYRYKVCAMDQWEKARFYWALTSKNFERMIQLFGLDLLIAYGRF